MKLTDGLDLIAPASYAASGPPRLWGFVPHLGPAREGTLVVRPPRSAA
jgi:hypothetical protein